MLRATNERNEELEIRVRDLESKLAKAKTAEIQTFENLIQTEGELRRLRNASSAWQTEKSMLLKREKDLEELLREEERKNV